MSGGIREWYCLFPHKLHENGERAIRCRIVLLLCFWLKGFIKKGKLLK